MAEGRAAKVVTQTVCGMCNHHCALNLQLENGRVTGIWGCRGHPWNQGLICPKARAAIDLVYAPDRLLQPLKKSGQGWRKITLEQALDEIAEQMLRLKERYGARSVAVWKGEAVGFAQQENLARRFCHAFGTPNYLSSDSMCFCGRHIAYRLVSGDWPLPDFPQSRCMVVWGANPPNSHPVLARMISEGKRRGAKLVVIDPRLSFMARQADLHVPLKPGTDGALALGLINELIRNNRFDREFVAGYTLGFEELAAYAAEFSPARVAAETGLVPGVTTQIAAWLAEAAPKVAVYTGCALEHHENGADNIRAIACLQGLCGSLDREGGNRLADNLPFQDLTLYKEIPLAHLNPLGARRYPVLYEFRRECHAMTAVDAVSSGEPYPLRAMLVIAANPALTHPNSRKVKKALESLDLLVVRDLFMSPTARLAHYVLPAATFLERSELHIHQMFQTVTLSPKILSFPGCQDEYSFWRALARRLAIGRFFPWADDTELNRWLLAPAGIGLEELAARPAGYCYRPVAYEKWRQKPFATPSGKVEFVSAYLGGRGYAALPRYRPPAALAQPDPAYPLVLITGARKPSFCNSRYHNIPGLRGKLPGPALEMHPLDALALGVSDGERVYVTSAVGSLTVPVQVTGAAQILPGSLQLTHGWEEANVNILTPDDVNDPISGFPLLKAVPVRVERTGEGGN